MKRICELLFPTSIFCFTFWLWNYDIHNVGSRQVIVPTIIYMKWVFIIAIIVSSIGLVYYIKKENISK